MINEKTITSQVSSNYGSNISYNGQLGTKSDSNLYKVGRICVFSVIFTRTGTATNSHLATVPASCYPLVRFNLSCDRYGETSGGECYIGSDGKIIFSNTQTGDFKISGTWITV